MKLFQVDSFTKEKFKGNPAGVCISEKPLPDVLMQQIAAEMNLSETAFVSTEDGYSRLRWFTPTSEVDLCGHATLATAHILFEQQYFGRNEALKFETRSGVLQVTSENSAQLCMDFPLLETKRQEPTEAVRQLFGEVVEMASTAKNDIVELPSAEAVAKASPDMGYLSKNSRQGIIITARGSGKWEAFDIVSRYFVPNVGVPEDPVTGSAHCELAHFWQQKLGKNELKAYQASARGGNLGVKIMGSRVMITGDAVTVFATTLKV
ncbi:PhzF family phenazine biosynthesis protein [Nafulsella turpanensis]|uniref:PhzF family phenazine biosynthesis protein n=1 Tax=Nafulsella turpanensis TaxID=1265690 RepID=UPI001267F807|nr:PhzF family phenazine biosynthesis isomerase [Nafulsella turpanensis]